MTEHSHGLYRVTGHRGYRGHTLGEMFEARLPSNAARRASERGDIELVRQITPELQPGSYRLPPGWNDPTTNEGGK